MVCVATDSEGIVNVAWAAPLKATVLASVVVSSLNVTVPLGVPAPDEAALIVAVKLTPCAYTEKFGQELTVVLLEALLTTWAAAESSPVLVRKLPSPL